MNVARCGACGWQWDNATEAHLPEVEAQREAERNADVVAADV